MHDPPSQPAVVGSGVRWSAPAQSELALTDVARHGNAVAQFRWCSLPQLLAVLQVNVRLNASTRPGDSR